MAGNPKATSAADKIVGSRISARRQMLGLSQEELGLALGLSFQQIQKYEKGINRVGATRLFDIAHVLGVTFDYFFEGATALGGKLALAPGIEDFDRLQGLFATKEGTALARAYLEIRDNAVRRTVVDMVRHMARASSQPAEA